VSTIEPHADKLKYIFDNAKVGIAICNAVDNTLELVNPAFAHIHGYEPHELIGASPGNVFAPECMLRLEAHESTHSCAISDMAFETTHIRKDGSLVPVSVHITVIKDEHGTITQRMANIQDISERKNKEELLYKKEREFRSLAENSPDVIIRYNCEGQRIYVNPMGEKLFGCSADEIIGKTPLEGSPIPAEMMFMEKFHTVIQTGKSIEVETAFMIPNGGEGWGHMRIVPEFDMNGKIVSVLTIGRDITERKIIEKKIEHIAHHDALTGLPNRILVKERTEQIIANAKSTGTKAAFLFIDLDGFKAINDTMGHSVGDEVLKIVASRLMETIRPYDTISRQGGDEFLLIFSDVTDINDLLSVVEKLLLHIEDPFPITEYSLSLSASIGIALYPEHGETFDSLLQNADTAMYKAKESGKNGYCLYTEQMHHNLLGEFKLQNDLKSAISNNEFVVHYQPQIDLALNRITGVEALIRWEHPQYGTIMPMNFIPFAESNGLIVQIGQWVLEEACTQAALWHAKGIAITVAVNISAVQFKRGNLEAVVKKALDISGINPRFLELELTESILIHDAENILKTVRSLKELGIQLSIDDFGTGYSSLSYLKRFAVDKLKIDQSFVRDILRDQEDAAIVRTIIQIAKSLNLKTIAEGVEDASVLNVIGAYGCDEVQGYHFTKPLEASAFELFYANFRN